jgi:hypothetical protein
MTSVTKVGEDLVQLAERLAQGERLCATTADEALCRDYQRYTAELARAVALFKTKLSSILASAPVLTPEIRQWALQQITDEQVMAGLTEVREQGGTDFGAVIGRLKQKQPNRERTNP